MENIDGIVKVWNLHEDGFWHVLEIKDDSNNQTTKL